MATRVWPRFRLWNERDEVRKGGVWLWGRGVRDGVLYTKERDGSWPLDQVRLMARISSLKGTVPFWLSGDWVGLRWEWVGSWGKAWEPLDQKQWTVPIKYNHTTSFGLMKELNWTVRSVWSTVQMESANTASFPSSERPANRTGSKLVLIWAQFHFKHLAQSEFSSFFWTLFLFLL